MTDKRKGGRSRAISSNRKFIKEVMANARKGASSRAPSSRAPSVVREIRKNREKPYKTEFKKETGKKKKLTFNTTYARAPAGYTFLHLGTPELAERCKELSRQRSLPVHVVNAQPSNQHAADPDKLSHYVHRIGYHFKTEVIEEACAELNYVMHGGHFIKEAELQFQHQQNFMSAVLQRHGINMDEMNRRETPEQVRAAIKELFPRIPDHDLDGIVTRAWKEGAGRVGTNTNMDLPRRVQLATIARIRHKYTDYDRLLKSFGWGTARKESEQYCLQKLIEWRGEPEDEDDNELEELVREIIVIDDDEENEEGSEADSGETDDEESDAVGETSDASVRYTHRIAAADDLRPESVQETSRSFIRRQQPVHRRTELQNNLAREKIGEARRAMRQEASYVTPSTSVKKMLTEGGNIMPVHVPLDRSGELPDTVVVDGQLYQREPPVALRVAAHPQIPNQHQLHDPMQISNQRMQTASFDRVMPSIEPHRPVSVHEEEAYRTMPQAIGPLRVEQVRNYDHRPHADPRPPPPNQFRPFHKSGQWVREQPTFSNEVIDLTTPERETHLQNPSPMRGVRTEPMQYRDLGHSTQDTRAVHGAALHDRPPLMQSQLLESSSAQRYQTAMYPIPYDPREPLLHFPEHYQYPSQYIAAHPVTPQPVHGAPAPVQQMPLGRR